MQTPQTTGQSLATTDDAPAPNAGRPVSDVADGGPTSSRTAPRADATFEPASGTTRVVDGRASSSHAPAGLRPPPAGVADRSSAVRVRRSDRFAGLAARRSPMWWLALATAGALGWADMTWTATAGSGLAGSDVAGLEAGRADVLWHARDDDLRPSDERATPIPGSGGGEAGADLRGAPPADVARAWTAWARYADEAGALTDVETRRLAAAFADSPPAVTWLAQAPDANAGAPQNGVPLVPSGGIGWGSAVPEPLSTTSPEAVGTVAVTIELPPRYQGVTVSWSGVPLDAQARRAGVEAWAPQQAQPAPIVAELAPGEWLLQARGTGNDAGLRFVARARVPAEPARVMLQVAPAAFDGSVAAARELPPSIAAPERVLDRSRLSHSGADDGDGRDDGYFCPTLSWSRAPCPFIDEAAALGFVLPQGFNADRPVFHTTAAGTRAEQPTLDVYRSVEDEARGVRRGDPVAVLNPRQWAASNGPCVPTRVGSLCLWLTADERPFDADRQALIDALVATLRRYPDDTDFGTQGPSLLNRLLSDAAE